MLLKIQKKIQKYVLTRDVTKNSKICPYKRCY